MTRSSSSPLAKPGKKRKSKGGSGPLINRLVGNFFYALTSPFPEVRKILQSRKQGYLDDADDLEYSRFEVLPLKTALLALAVYLTIGILSYHIFLERWPIVDSIYFSCVCFSTVGYGDLCPSTIPSKIFTCLFGFSGIALLGAVVANLGSKLVNLELEAVQRVQKESRKSLIRVFDLMPKVVKLTQNTTKRGEETKILQKVKKEHLQQTTKSNTTEANEETSSLPELILTDMDKPISWRATAWRAFQWTGKALSVVIMGGLLVGKMEGWSLFDSVYYSLITATTIGLGDFSPQTRNGRIMAIFMIPTLVAAAGEVLAGIGLTLVERRQKKIFEHWQTGMTKSYLAAMDSNGDGQVSREEYVLFMLTEMGMVNPTEIQELKVSRNCNFNKHSRKEILT